MPIQGGTRVSWRSTLPVPPEGVCDPGTLRTAQLVRDARLSHVAAVRKDLKRPQQDGVRGRI